LRYTFPESQVFIGSVSGGTVARKIRYQGAVVRDDHILLIKHTERSTGRSYWVIPGGGIEAGETEEACVEREMHEETCLRVQVQSLLLDQPDSPGGSYQRRKTYLCFVLSGEAAPGYEPEEEAATKYAITEVCWFDLRDATSWDRLLLNDSITYPIVQQVQQALGYTLNETTSV
jgi:8-oxo-dGTP diphosphatase